MSAWDDATAQWYADNYGDYATTRLAVERLDIAPGSRVADIGCGTGASLRHLASRVPSCTLIGIDPSPRMVAIAREASPDIAFHTAAAEQLPLDDASCDWVWAFDSMDHWDDVETGLAEVLRVLAVGGHVAIVKDLDAPSTETVSGRVAETPGFTLVSFESVEKDGVRFDLWVAKRV